MWRYGGGDWTAPWRVYHGLGDDFRPIDDPEGAPKRIRYVARYRYLLYGMAKAAAIMEEGVKDRPALPPPRRRPPDPGKPGAGKGSAAFPYEEVTESGLVLPTGPHPAPR